MANSYFVTPDQDTVNSVAQKAAKLRQQIAIAVLKTEVTGDKPDKYETFYFVSSASGSEILFRNDKRLLLKMHLDLNVGLEYETPKNKDGSTNLTLVSLMLDIANNSHVVDTTLGLSWLHIAFSVYQIVRMKRIDAVSTEIIEATIQDWIDAINHSKMLDTDKLAIATWLLEKSAIAYRLDIEDRKALEVLIVSLTPVTPQQTVSTPQQANTPKNANNGKVAQTVTK